MILGSGSGNKSFLQRAKISATTSIFYDLFMNNAIGHKIVTTMQCEAINIEKSKVFMKHKMKEIVKKYPHFGSRIVKHVWTDCEIDYDKMVIIVDKTHMEITEELINVPFPKELPGWQVYITKDNCVMLICDHTYGDGAYIANIALTFFDNDELNNLPSPSREKRRSLSLISRIMLFFKILYLIYMRFKFVDKSPPAPWIEPNNKQIELATFSLSELKTIRDRFSCTHISINDLIHTLITRTNSIYLKKNTITSAAMFNMRKNTDDLNDQNKLGYILIANKVKEGAMPEELLKDVHDFMQFYKVTPATAIISKCMHLYYAWNNKKMCKLLQDLNKSVDFIISNYILPYKDKSIQQGIKVVNAIGTVTPCDAPQMYSVTSYGDKVNVYLTYNKNEIKDIERLQNNFNDSLKWLCK
jgi:hypothetical protein